MSNTMKAIRYHDHGESSTLKLESVAKPVPGAGEVLVKVAYSGVNPIDWKLRSGMLKAYMPQTLPAIPGVEFSGVVEAVGAGVEQFTPGHKVFGASHSTYAEHVVVAQNAVARVPEGLSMDRAATVALGSLTAWRAVEDANIKAGETVVVLGAAGGVGLFAVQFALAKGAKVLGVASTSNLAFVKSLGAEAVDYTAGSLAASIGKVDVVIDTAGGAALEGAYDLVKKGGLLVTVAGMVSEEKAKSLGITALGTGNKGPEPLGKIHDLLAAGKLVTEVSKTFPLAEAAAAQDLSQTGHGRGRIVLKV